MIGWYRRDKTLNYFNIMLRKRLKNDEDGAGVLEEGESSKKKSSKTDKSLVRNMLMCVRNFFDIHCSRVVFLFKTDSFKALKCIQIRVVIFCLNFISEITYYVSSGMLNSTHSLSLS